jgi:hypothetical protein
MATASVDCDLGELRGASDRQRQRAGRRLDPSLPPAGIRTQRAEDAALDGQRRPAARSRFAAIWQQNEAVVLLPQPPRAGGSSCASALAGGGDIGRLQAGGNVVDTGQRPDRRQQRRVC